MICQTKRERKYEVLSICSSFSFLFYGDSTISCGKKQQENPSFDRNLHGRESVCFYQNSFFWGLRIATTSEQGSATAFPPAGKTCVLRCSSFSPKSVAFRGPPFCRLAMTKAGRLVAFREIWFMKPRLPFREPPLCKGRWQNQRF